MFLEIILFWLWSWLVLELWYGKYLATHLSLILCWIILLAGLLFILNFDLLATFLIGVYSSVFVAVSLFALQLGPFWSPVSRFEWNYSGKNSFILFIIVVLIMWTQYDFTSSGEGWEDSILWQDLFESGNSAGGLQTTLLHWFFFRCFIVETLVLNLYLFIGLIGVVFFLSWRNFMRYPSSESTLISGGSTRNRLISSVRRQVRRTHSSRLRSRH